MSDRLFRDRRDAGRALVGLLEHYRGRGDVLVLGLPRGGVPVAYEVAMGLDVALDIFLVRKLGLPSRPELAMGAIASGGVVVTNDDVIRGTGVSFEVLQEVADTESRELLRLEREYRGEQPMPDIAGKVVILVDDGLATGAGMRAAIEAVRRLAPRRIVIAVPAAPQSSCEELGREVDEVVCATTPAPFLAVGESYWDFTQVSDDGVRSLMAAAARARRGRAQGPGELTVIRLAAIPTDGGVPPDDELLDLVGDARFVLIGGASHGTNEFTTARARLTRKLIEAKGFSAVAVDAGWSAAAQVHHFLRTPQEGGAERALRGFTPFPTWLGRNAEVRDLVDWLRGYEQPVGWYGLDLYGLPGSFTEVLAHLEKVDPAAAARARECYSCFDHNDGDGQQFGFTAAFGAGESVERAIVDRLVGLRRRTVEQASRTGLLADDELFHAERNVELVRDAPRFYRLLLGGRRAAWNLRERHLANTLTALAEHLDRRPDSPAKIVVWAHNSQVGDARATELAARGELTLGQIVREEHPGESRLIGFTTYGGTVTAADYWGAPADRKRVRPAVPGSVEELLHKVGRPEFLLRLGESAPPTHPLHSAMIHRTIGVIYRPLTERHSHYLRVRLADAFDAVIHIDETRALEPLRRTARWETGELPETFAG